MLQVRARRGELRRGRSELRQGSKGQEGGRGWCGACLSETDWCETALLLNFILIVINMVLDDLQILPLN